MEDNFNEFDDFDDFVEFDLEEEEEEIDYDNLDVKPEDIKPEACFDNIKDEKDLEIGFDPDELLKNREELKINLIYFDDKITKSNDSYDYYKKFKVNVVGGFYASDEIDIFRKYLKEINNLNNNLKKIPPYIIVTYPNNFEEIYNICENYKFVKRIVLINPKKQQYAHYLKTHKKLLRYIASSYEDLCKYLKQIGILTSKWNSILSLFNSNRIFTSKDIQMDRQLNTCPIITTYEYDELYFLVHRAYAHFFTNDSLRQDPRHEKQPKFEEKNFEKIKEFLKNIDITEEEKKNLLNKFTELRNSENFTVDAIKKYTGESFFCYLLNRVMRNFEKGLIKLAYYVGPLLFGLNKYALENPDKCLNKDTTLYRKLEVSPLDKYIYKFSIGHIICFPSLTSTSVVPNKFKPTDLGKNINKVPNKNQKNSEKDNNVEINMIIKYKHQEGNISPGLDISDLSSSKNEKEILIFPFTFFRVNKIETNPDNINSYIFYMEIINRKKIIEYDLKEGTRFNTEDLEELYDEDNENNEMNLDEGKPITFHVREEEPNKKDKKERIKKLFNIFNFFQNSK